MCEGKVIELNLGGRFVPITNGRKQREFPWLVMQLGEQGEERKALLEEEGQQNLEDEGTRPCWKKVLVVRTGPGQRECGIPQQSAL